MDLLRWAPVWQFSSGEALSPSLVISLQHSLDLITSCCDPSTPWTTSVDSCSHTSTCGQTLRATHQVSVSWVCPLSCVTAWEPVISPCVAQACRGQCLTTHTHTHSKVCTACELRLMAETKLRCAVVTEFQQKSRTTCITKSSLESVVFQF